MCVEKEKGYGIVNEPHSTPQRADQHTLQSKDFEKGPDVNTGTTGSIHY